MANFINKDVVRQYIETNHKEISNCDLSALDSLVFGIVFEWIRRSKGKTLKNLSYQIVASIARSGVNRSRRIHREAIICNRCKKVSTPAWVRRANERMWKEQEK